jgi:3-oxoacyl-[acyl-carrier-protein] synthase II
MKHVSINATKSMIGHCLGAAGGLEAIATLKAIETGMLHPSINIDEPEEMLEGIDYVPRVAKAKKVTAAFSNSFGFGGHNSTLILAPYKER